MIDILIRAHNEATWLPLLLKSIAKQKNIEVDKILIIDNLSSDDPKRVKEFFPELNIIYKEFNEKYLPGKMLNYGINILNKDNCINKYICIISAHCFFKDSLALFKLHQNLVSSENCRSAFGRQIPMTISDPQAIRDLVLMYPKENRLISKAPAFNNAFSMIKYKALEDNLFDNNTTNLEDVIWASNELKKGYKISYCAESEIVHYHGPHQEDKSSRLLSTELTIKKYSDVFNISLKKADIDKKDIVPIFVAFRFNDLLIEIIKKFSLNQKIILWTNQIDEIGLDSNQLENIVWIKREIDNINDESLYDNFPNLYKQLVNKKMIRPFYIMYDNSVNKSFKLINTDMAIENLKDNFGNVIWPSIESKKLIFSLNEKSEWISNQQFSNNKFEKNKAIEVLRGNGTILSASSIQNPTLMFKKPRFLYINQ